MVINDRWILRIPGTSGTLLDVGVVLMEGVVLGLCTPPAALTDVTNVGRWGAGTGHRPPPFCVSYRNSGRN